MDKELPNLIKKDNLKKTNVLYLILVGIYFFGYQSIYSNYLIIFSTVIWLTMFKVIKSEYSVTDTLISLMIFSIPISYVNIAGNINATFLNWFNIFSFIFLVVIFIMTMRNPASLTQNIKKVNYHHYLTIILWFLVFLLNSNGSINSRNSFLLIIFYLILLVGSMLSSSLLVINYQYVINQYTRTVFITSLFVIIQYILYKQFNLEFGRIEIYGNNRIAFGFINFDFSFLSLYLLSTFFFYFTKILSNKKLNYASILGILIVVFASAITTARTGVMALAGSLIIYVFVNIFKSKNKFKVSTKIYLSLIIGFFMLSSLYLVLGNRGLSGSGRVQGYFEALHTFSENITFGEGLDYLSLGVKPHNLIIQLLSQMGVFVTVATLLSLFLIVKDIFYKNKVLFYNVLLVFIGSMFIPDILVSKYLNILLIIGILQESRLETSKVRVAHVMSSGGYSGAEKVAVNLIKSSGPKIDSYYVSQDGAINNILREKEINHIVLKNTSKIELKEKIDLLSCDIVYAHDFKASLLSAILFPNKIVISHIHQNPIWFSKVNIRSILYLIASVFISEIIYVSEETQETFVFKSLVKNKTRIVYNYVDKNEVISMSLKSNDAIKFDLVYLGRFEDVKNPIKFVEIVSRIKEDIPISAVMIGDGSLMEEVKLLISNLNLESDITLIGYSPNPYSILKNCKISVITSKWEGFGLSAVESMILGVPVVANDVGGLKEVLKGGGGYLCQSDQMYIDSIKKILLKDNYSHLSYLAKKSSQRFTSTANWEESIRLIFEDVR